MAMLQNNFSEEAFTNVRRQYNLNIINLANLQTDFIMKLPSKLNKLAEFTDKISNLSIISGNCFLSKPASNFKELSVDKVIFNKDFNTFKLRPQLSYFIEPVEFKNKLITNQKVRIFNVDKTELRTLDDLLIRKEPINIITSENRYEYTLSLSFNEIKTFNNIFIKLNEETLSYPTISKVFYIDSNQEQKGLKLLNINATNLDLDLYKNSTNTYELDIDTITSDNIQIVLTDNVDSLILDEILLNYMDYSEEGSIVLEALRESKPILKVGIEGNADDNIEFQVSYDKETWYPMDLSNSYGIEKINKVLAFNTISPETIKASTDVKAVYIKLLFKTLKTRYVSSNKLNREVYRTSTFNISNLPLTSYSLYENTNSVYFGKLSNVNTFNYLDLYKQGEYLITDNKYFIKGFNENLISKVPSSKYTYSPVTLKSKAIRKNGKLLKFDNVDISSKEIYTFRVENISKNILEASGTEYVLPLKDSVRKDIYYLSQGNSLIEIDLTLGFINSVLDILYTVEDNKPIYLLDSFKTLIREIPSFKIEIESEILTLVSLLDADLFKQAESLSRTYPLEPLSQYQIGLLDNRIESNNKDIKIDFYELIKNSIYLEDFISNDNSNYSKVLSEKDYKLTCLDQKEVIPSYSREFNLVENSIVKGSIKFSNNSLMEIPFSNGYNEFLEFYSKSINIKVPSTVNSNEYKLELLEEEISKDSLAYTLTSDTLEDYSISIQEEQGKYFLRVRSDTNLKSFSFMVSYTYKNLNPKAFFSLDYSKGILYFSEPIQSELIIEYKYDNMLCIGKSAKQLLNKDFNEVSGNINIKNYEENSFLYFVYRNNMIQHRQITPILKDLKMNYILKDELSL